MSTSDDERDYLEALAHISDAGVCFLPDMTNEAVVLLEALRDSSGWTSSDRPDFYSDRHKVAIEVMRVDDHPQIGNLTNPTLAREARLAREVRDAMPWLGADVRVTVVGNTGLPTHDDHNYQAYRDTFSRVVTSHAAKVPTYRAHHPGYALAMLIRDESSAYAEAVSAGAGVVAGEPRACRPHLWFLDARFIETIEASNAEFVIWSTPYKHVWHIDDDGERMKIPLPELCIFNVAALPGWSDPLAYDPSRLVSVEE